MCPQGYSRMPIWNAWWIPPTNGFSSASVYANGTSWIAAWPHHTWPRPPLNNFWKKPAPSLKKLI